MNLKRVVMERIRAETREGETKRETSERNENTALCCVPAALMLAGGVEGAQAKKRALQARPSLTELGLSILLGKTTPCHPLSKR